MLSGRGCWIPRCVGTAGYYWCVLCVGGSGRVILPLPVPSPCNNVVMVLGTGASFVEGFMSFTEASIIAGTRSGGSCGTNCGELHPPCLGLPKQDPGKWTPWEGCGGDHPLGSVVGLQQMRVVG